DAAAAKGGRLRTAAAHRARGPTARREPGPPRHRGGHGHRWDAPRRLRRAARWDAAHRDGPRRRAPHAERAAALLRQADAASGGARHRHRARDLRGRRALAGDAARRDRSATANAPIGPSAAVAAVRADGATVYVGTHRPFGVREQIAKAIGIEERKVRVIPQITSGTYGRNTHGDAAIEAAILSKAAGRPVLLQWTREEEFVWSPSRPEAVLE